MDSFDVIVIAVPHDEFEDAVRGVHDWTLVAQAVSEDSAADVMKQIDEADIIYV